MQATGLNLENVRVSERNQSPRVTRCVTPLTEMSRAGNSRDRKKVSRCLSVGDVKWGWRAVCVRSRSRVLQVQAFFLG